MIHHTTVAITDIARSKELYSKMLAPLGYSIGADMPEYKVAGFSDGEGMDFWISEKEVSGTHVAFVAKNQRQVEEFHKFALETGAKDNGAPGYRTGYHAGYFAAFVHDYDGNNIEAVWTDTSKL